MFLCGNHKHGPATVRSVGGWRGRASDRLLGEQGRPDSEIADAAKAVSRSAKAVRPIAPQGS
jgi:hypothetical protein